MTWARVSAAIGVLLLLAAFALGTEVTPSAEDTGRSYTCPPVVSAETLVSGRESSGGSATRSLAESRRVAACSEVEAVTHWAFGGTLALGALALVVGWTALREREVEDQRVVRTVTPA